MAADEDRARQTDGVGPVGRRAAGNLRTLRDGRRVTTDQLSRLLGRLGRPIRAEGITRTESGARRIDVDDLVALAVALDTTPNRLLLNHPLREEDVQLTGELTLGNLEAWRWALGQGALPVQIADEVRGLISDDRERAFARENSPDEMPGPLFRNVGHDLRDYPDVALALSIIVRDAHAQGVSLGSMRRILERLYIYARFGQIETVITQLSNGGS